jgi:hypothetical protein
MKVNIDETVDVSPSQRQQIAAVIDGRVKPKRDATREELKRFIWGEGTTWDIALADQFMELEDRLSDTVPGPASDNVDSLDDLL